MTIRGAAPRVKPINGLANFVPTWTPFERCGNEILWCVFKVCLRLPDNSGVVMTKQIVWYGWLLCLSACTSQTVAVVPVAPITPVVAVQRAPVTGVVPSPLSSQSFTKIALSGESTLLNRFTTLNADCTPRTAPVVRITQAPVHGTTQIVQQNDYPSYPANNPRSACNKTKEPTTAVLYKSNAGFVGTDYLVFSFFSEGKEIENKVTITVK